MCCEMITTIVLADIFVTSYNYHFIFVVRTFRIHSLSNFKIYNTILLPLMTMKYIRYPELIHLVIQSLYLLTNFSLFS